MFIPASRTLSSTGVNQLNQTDKHLKDNLPVLYIDGGPGSGGAVKADHLYYWKDVIVREKLKRLVILFSAVGTLGSSSNIVCYQYQQAQNVYFHADSHSKIDTANAMLSQAIKQCAAQIKDKTIYASMYQADLIANMMTALGIDRYHVWGASYGTRLALLLAQKNAVQRIFLDSPYLFDQGSYAYKISLYYNALRLLDKKWQHEFNNQHFISNFYSAINKVTFQNINIDVTNRRLKESYILKDITYKLTDARLFELAFFALYSHKNTMLFFDLLKKLSANNAIINSVNHTHINNTNKDEKTYFESQHLPSLTLSNQLIDDFIDSQTHTDFNPLTYHLVECLDNPQSTQNEIEQSIIEGEKNVLNMNDGLSDVNQKDKLALLARLKNTIYKEFQDYPCKAQVFNEQALKGYKLKNKAYTKKPTLITVGEFDPITPMKGLKKLANKSNITTIVNKHTGHGVLANNTCNTLIIKPFLNAKKITLLNNCYFK